MPRQPTFPRLVAGALAAVVATSVWLAGNASPGSSASTTSTAEPNSVAAFGDAVNLGSVTDPKFGGLMPGEGHRPIVGMATPSSGGGYWLVRSDGRVFAFAAGHFGSLRGMRLARPIVGIAATPTGTGYWLVGADGGVFTFGDAGFFGSLAATKLAGPIVGITPTRSGHGYWLVGSDGGVFAFGDAGFFGSLGNVKLASPIVGMAAPRARRGYWLVGADGGVFAFGGAHFLGSLGGVRLARPIVGMAASAYGRGYWLVGADGGVFTFGDARNFGSLGQLKLASPAVGIVASYSGYGYWIVTQQADALPPQRGYPIDPIGPNFQEPIPGAPLVRARLDHTGLHFKPARVASGVYNVAFSDTRTNRIPGTDVALNFYSPGPFGGSLLSVHAGETGGGILCTDVNQAVTVDGFGILAPNPGLIIEPPDACPTPLT